MPTTLETWIDYIQTLHAREIDLTLDRVDEVYRRLYPNGAPFKVISIAGTNGKGSTGELIASIYNNANYRVGKYSSPHISKFNERYSINGADVEDAPLLEAFVRVEQQRRETKLTYFEFGTLIAIELFARAEVDIAVMEVGLGGRLDAVNILEPDVAIVTSISIDHTAWLGDNIEDIGREKIGIARAGIPCILGMAQPPQSIEQRCAELGVDSLKLGVDFHAIENIEQEETSTWSWQSADHRITELDLPFGQAGHQLSNAALAVQAVYSFAELLPVTDTTIRQAISSAEVKGRCQVVSRSPLIVLDVAHNVDSVAGLANFIAGLRVNGNVKAVCGMLADKQITETLLQLTDLVDEWYFATIDNSRAATASEIAANLQKALTLRAIEGSIEAEPESHLFDQIIDAYTSASESLQIDDCLVVFGSFFVVSDIINII